MKKPDEIKRVKDDPTCFECNHYEVCQMWSDAGYLHKDNPKKCSHFAGRSSERRKISTLQTIVDEQDKVIQKLEAQVPGWISVEERLPKIYETVIIWRSDCREATIGWWFQPGWSVPKGVEVTHWMPLPSAPECVPMLGGCKRDAGAEDCPYKGVRLEVDG